LAGEVNPFNMMANTLAGEANPFNVMANTLAGMGLFLSLEVNKIRVLFNNSLLFRFLTSFGMTVWFGFWGAEEKKALPFSLPLPSASVMLVIPNEVRNLFLNYKRSLKFKIVVVNLNIKNVMPMEDRQKDIVCSGSIAKRVTAIVQI
jgi:hypothetical protein